MSVSMVKTTSATAVATRGTGPLMRVGGRVELRGGTARMARQDMRRALHRATY